MLASVGRELVVWWSLWLDRPDDLIRLIFVPPPAVLVAVDAHRFGGAASVKQRSVICDSA